MMALQAARDTDSATLLRRLRRWRLAGPPAGGSSAQSGRPGTGSDRWRHSSDEPAFQVRYELIGAIGRLALDDQALRAARRALQGPVAPRRHARDGCRAGVLHRSGRRREPSGGVVQSCLEKPSRHRDVAFAGARVDRFGAAEARGGAAQARGRSEARPSGRCVSAAAAAAGVLADEDVALTLSPDEVANVRTAALEALSADEERGRGAAGDPGAAERQGSSVAAHGRPGAARPAGGIERGRVGGAARRAHAADRGGE